MTLIISYHWISWNSFEITSYAVRSDLWWFLSCSARNADSWFSLWPGALGCRQLGVSGAASCGQGQKAGPLNMGHWIWVTLNWYHLGSTEGNLYSSLVIAVLLVLYILGYSYIYTRQSLNSLTSGDGWGHGTCTSLEPFLLQLIDFSTVENCTRETESSFTRTMGGPSWLLSSLDTSQALVYFKHRD